MRPRITHVYNKYRLSGEPNVSLDFPLLQATWNIDKFIRSEICLSRNFFADISFEDDNDKNVLLSEMLHFQMLH